nr:transmembrane protein C1orf162 homolog isoform X2 [Halichoerus grypus]XP_035959573.1 transmembrane protein C1orf162 homolog isoform X2 [Halichoerus grypus]XP_035959574.1 transmembrane protein C1orf162 homolog isoform X2 [Halichoerus grypus]
MGGWHSKPEPNNGWGPPPFTSPSSLDRVGHLGTCELERPRGCGRDTKPLCALSSPADRQSASTAAPTTASAPGFLEHTNIQHLILAFFAGVLLTLLLLVLIFLIRKSYRKCHSSPWALNPPLDPHSSRDPPAKLSSPEEAHTYASIAFEISEEKSDHLTKKHSAPLDPVVYAPIKVTDSPCLSNEA